MAGGVKGRPHMQRVVIDWIGYGASTYPDKLATVELPSGRRQTYKEMHDRVGRIATWLKGLGVQRGDRVGVLALNSTDALDIIFATWRIGAVHLALNFRLTPSELDYIIGNAEPKVLIHDCDTAATAEGLSVRIEEVIETAGQGQDSPFEQAIASVAEPTEEMVDLSTEDQCLLMYSSGTTGLPKGVIITHGMVVWAQVNSVMMHSAQEMVSLAVMPIFHIGGLQVFTFPALYAGGTAVVIRTFDPGATLDAISDPQLGVTHFLGVPAIYNAMRDHPKNPDADLSRLKIALVGAEAVPEALVHWWHERGLVIQEGYGMTENMASCCIVPAEDTIRKVGFCGKTLRHIEVKVVRSDGTKAEVDETGEILCRGPVVTPGYWHNEDATRDAFVDGWFRTGDVGLIDGEGFLQIRDRVKDMYISGGENVYPAEVENVLYQLPEIREVAVIGVPDDRWGETGCAVVALQEGSELSAEQVRAHCQPKLARFKLPSHVVFVDTLPRNATGKVLKFQLRKSVQV